MLPSERSDKVNKRIREILDTLNSGSVRGDEYNRLKDECRQLKRYGGLQPAPDKQNDQGHKQKLSPKSEAKQDADE